MYDLSRHPYFDLFVDTESGIKSYILNKAAGDIQRHFYYTNNSVTPDGEWLWILAAQYPATAMYLCAVRLDPDNPEFRTYLNTAGMIAETAMVAPDGSGVYYANMCKTINTINYIDLYGNIEVVFEVPKEEIKDRLVHRIATHLTISCDGKKFLLDSTFGLTNVIATADRETGEYDVLLRTNTRYNHGQFSFHDPELFMIAQDWQHHPVTGEVYSYNHRSWLMRTDKRMFRPVTPDLWAGHNSNPCHEWWTQDGRICWVDYVEGVYELSMDDYEPHLVWNTPLCHAHSNSDATKFCADESPYKWQHTPVKILYYDRNTGKETKIVSAMKKPDFINSPYHTDPHPQFTPDDSAIVYTTTETSNRCTIAICPTEQFEV